MSHRLFVYGTLAPGRSNAHVLASVPGTWECARVRGTVLDVTWGPAAGYPGLVLGEDGGEVQGMVLTSDALPAHWARLDAFEGEGYTRVPVTATLDGSGARVQAFVYVLSALGLRR